VGCEDQSIATPLTGLPSFDGEQPMAGGWTDVTDRLNTFFGNSSWRAQMGRDFRQKHGNHGHGDQAAGKPPYSLGRFLEDFQRPDDSSPMLTDKQKGQFQVDSGLRHWDPTSLMNVETAIRNNLTRRNASGTGFEEKKMVFSIDTDPSATLARATVTEVPERTVGGVTEEAHTKIEIVCPPRIRTDP
jgi:hypothetical protein